MNFSWFSWTTVLYFLIGIAGIDILVIFHEFGHCLAARACKIKVQTVSFGLGPALFRFRKGETEFVFCWIPFGGATTMAGKDDLKRAIEKKASTIEHCEEGSIFAASPLRRIITYLAGPVANLIFAIICFIILSVMPVLSLDLTSEIRLTSDSEVYSDLYCPAKEAGLLTGDTITSVAGNNVSTWDELQNLLTLHSSDDTVTVETQRGQFTISPSEGKFGLLPNGRYLETRTPGKPLIASIGPAFSECISQIGRFLNSLTGVFMGREKLGKTLGGTFSASETIGKIAGKSFEISFSTGIRVVLYLLASVSISLGLANLLPISALDGGLILISFAEIIIKRPIHPKTHILLQTIGLIVVLGVIPVLRLFL